MDRKALRGPLLFVTTVLLGGCATAALQAEPPAYFDGYYAGCEIGAAMVMAGANLPGKDRNRYAADLDYRRGWEFGYNECRMEAEGMQGV